MKKYLGVLCAVLLTVVCLVVPASASDVPSCDFDAMISKVASSPENWDYFVASQNSFYRCVGFYKGKFKPVAYSSGENINLLNISDSSSPVVFWNYDGTEWKYCGSPIEVSSGSRLSAMPNNLATVVYSSSVDIYDSNGNLFFQAPPPPPPGLGEVVEGLTLAQGESVRNQAVGVMKILVPCGVGCLALLTALPVLKKVFHRFQPL